MSYDQRYSLPVEKGGFLPYDPTRPAFPTTRRRRSFRTLRGPWPKVFLTFLLLFFILCIINTGGLHLG